MIDTIGPRLVALLPRLRRFALALSRRADVADDMVQAACERILANRDQLGPDLPIEAYLFRILRNLWHDRLRHGRVRGIEVEPDAIAEALTCRDDLAVERKLVLARVSEAMDRLPPESRELLLLVCVEEMSYREAAEALDIPIGTVMSRLARARKRLAEETGLTRTEL